MKRDHEEDEPGSIGNIKTTKYIIPIHQIASFSNLFNAKNYKQSSSPNNIKNNKTRIKEILDFIYILI